MVLHNKLFLSLLTTFFLYSFFWFFSFFFFLSSFSLFSASYTVTTSATTGTRCIVSHNAVLCQTTNEQTSSPRPPFQLAVTFYFIFAYQQPPSTIPSFPRTYSLSVPLIREYNPSFCPLVLLTQVELSDPVHLPHLHFNSHSCPRFRFFWPSEAPGCVFPRQTINSSPKKINALKRKLGAFLAKCVLERKIDLLLIGF